MLQTKYWKIRKKLASKKSSIFSLMSQNLNYKRSFTPKQFRKYFPKGRSVNFGRTTTGPSGTNGPLVAVKTSKKRPVVVCPNFTARPLGKYFLNFLIKSWLGLLLRCGVLGHVNLVLGFRTRSRFSFQATTVRNWAYPTECPLYLMKTKMQNIKKVYSCTK